VNDAIPIDEGLVCGLIPARGGSKSIPLKNMVPLAGRPLLDYVIGAAAACPELSAVYCSTDHEKIAAFCRNRGVTVIPRPAALAQDDTPVVEVMRQVLRELAATSGAAPGLLVLLQPTSPFLLPEHISSCLRLLRENPAADSAQTIAPVAHNNHAFNQRLFIEGQVSFRFLEERRQAYNKQRKPKFFKFGNLVVSRSRALLAGKDPFGDISLGVEIKPPYDVDVDGPDDLEYTEFLLTTKKIIL